MEIDHMKPLLFVFLLFPAAVFAQTDKDYQDVMDKFVRYYNAGQIDSVCTLFPVDTSLQERCFWRWAEQNESSLKEYGKIESYKYLGKVTQGQLALFKVVYKKKGKKAMTFDLSENNLFGTFRFDTRDEEIDELLKKEK
jgi:hypothetical protein